MNLSHWQLLVAVADAGNITRAAERVGMTQSGASQAIAQMEASLGLAVFTRERRQISVTALGEPVIDHARAMLASLDAIRALADESQGLSRGRIRLACFPTVVAQVLPDLLRPFQRRHPGIELVTLEGSDLEVEEWLASGAAEIGVVLNPAAARRPVILGRSAWVAVLPSQHALARRASAQGVSWAELAPEPFVLATGGCRTNAQSLSAQAGVVLQDIRVTLRDWASACVLVKEGMGVTVVPESTLPDDLRGVRVMPLQPAIFREYGLVCAPAAQDSRPVQALLESLRDDAPVNMA